MCLINNSVDFNVQDEEPVYITYEEAISDDTMWLSAELKKEGRVWYISDTLDHTLLYYSNC